LLVRHALWLTAEPASAPGRLAIWAEDSTLPPSGPRKPGRSPRSTPHPYAAQHQTLRASRDLSTATSAVETVSICLPTRGAAPVSSPELVREVSDPSRGALHLSQWMVPALVFDADAALKLLRDDDVAEGIAGASLTHLTHLVEFAVDLVARGRVLPGVRLLGEDAPGAYALWHPLVTGGDAGWARTLATSMPPPLFAADPANRLERWANALDSLVDAAVRNALGPSRLDQRRIGDAVTRAWLGALTGRVRQFAAQPAEITKLGQALNIWQADAVAGPVRACFRLVEPPLDAVDDQAWQLRFALQAADEPSLVVDAADVWRSRGRLPALARHADAPRETLLAELGKASRLYTELDGALRVARPQSLALDTEGAHRFLTATAPALATAGFGVQLPGWWRSGASRLGLRVAASTPAQPGQVAGGASMVGVNAIVDFGYQLAIGEEPLTSSELAELAELKAPMVRFRGRWIEVDPRRLAAGLKLVGQRSSTTVGELLRVATGADAAVADLPITEVAADGWLGDLLSGQAEHRLRVVEVAPDFSGQLRAYQARGLAWLDFLSRTGLGGVLADDMGLGKTVQLLALFAGDAAAAASSMEPEPGASLLICPMSLVGNWQREAARFTPKLRLHVHHGGERARGRHFADAVAAADLVITTYALAARDAAELSKINWRRVVVDEAQAIKNSATKQAVAIRSLPASSRIAVTGTPVENRLADLWSILEFANPGMLGSAAGFKKRYAEPIERQGDEEAAVRLRRFTGPFILRRVKTDPSIIADLPDKFEMDVLCNLTAEQAGLYQAVVDDMLARIASSEGIERRGLVLATMTKLKQVCNHPAHFLRDGSALSGRSGKLERLEQILTEVLEVGERALLFTQYAEFGAMIRGHLAGRFGREVLFLHGGVQKAARDDMVARFQSEERTAPALFVLSLKAGGTGLTLTAANHVVHLDRWWNPAVEDQATDRAFRIGQRRSVQVRKFVCAGTVEEKIALMITQKRGLAAKIVGTGEQWLTELSTSELAELLRLERGAEVE
jgi:SNF2-related domain/SNF2 Helicase protein/Helicase conserved C-terminal domain